MAEPPERTREPRTPELLACVPTAELEVELLRRYDSLLAVMATAELSDPE